jgi:hypothetical protein
MENNIVNKKKYVLFVAVVLLVLGNVFFIIRSNILSNKLATIENQGQISNKNGKVIDFMSLFVNKVLKSNTEIDFDTRLSLENSVRATGDEELVGQWQKFTNSKTEAEAQVEVKNLLGIIAEKLK